MEPRCFAPALNRVNWSHALMLQKCVQILYVLCGKSNLIYSSNDLLITIYHLSLVFWILTRVQREKSSNWRIAFFIKVLKENIILNYYSRYGRHGINFFFSASQILGQKKCPQNHIFPTQKNSLNGSYFQYIYYYF